MISIEKVGGANNTKGTEFRGLSTDTKPTRDDIPNGSVFFEIDTAKVYMYSLSTQTWHEL